ncbi:MAG TPA: nitrile hydratase subunit beta [Caulobacteraceae bacterium]|nr:nitrile hydratase subunit beta [Caulobacteraceae bacterium]
MDGVHDMGGMDGFGPVLPEPDEPVFHAPWEARVLGLRIAMAAHQLGSLDSWRHDLERLPPAEYLSTGYYERWLIRLTDLIAASGLASREEMATGKAASGERGAPPLTAELVPIALGTSGSYQRQTGAPPRFAPGQSVRARNIHPHGHTRLPRYVRGRQGRIEADHGAHVFPDSNAHGGGEAPQRLYTVSFPARELWGEGDHEVRLDLWESYLEPA